MAATVSDAIPDLSAEAYAMPGMILALAPALDAEDRRPVVETMLLGALAARRADGTADAWITVLTQALSKIGWSIAAFEAARSAAFREGLTLGQSLAEATEQVAKNLDSGPAIAAIQRASRDVRASGLVLGGDDRAGTCRVALALAHEQNGGAALQLMEVVATLLPHQAGPARVGDLEATVASADLQTASARLMLQRDRYRPLASAIRDKIESAVPKDLVPLAAS